VVESVGRRQGFDVRLGRDIRRIAREHRATVMHCHHYSPFIYGSLARMYGANARVVFTEHGRTSDAPPSRKRRVANVLFRQLADRVFAVSQDLRRHLIAEGFRPDAVEVIYNGIDPGPSVDRGAAHRLRREFNIPASALVIGSVGRLDPVKDIRTLLAALVEVRRTHPAEAVIIGDGPERPRLEAAAFEYGVAPHVHFLGYRHDAREWLADSDVYVNCSISEGVSLTILEAMAAAVPVIATRVGGTPEILDSTCGILIQPRDPHALAGALMQLANDRQQGRQLGQAGRIRVEERFTLDRMIRQYADIYRAVASHA
jgi:glycosyltransferase involved in cell wall biosynthesis